MKSYVKKALNRLTGNAAVAEPRPVIDYPLPGEAVASTQYSVRITVPGTPEHVDLSINRGPWLPCRSAAGCYWYDWAGYSDGKYELIARIPGPDGRWTMTPPLKFTVSLKP